MIVDDVTLIPRYHPDVDTVDLIAGQARRAVGTKYQCNNTCYWATESSLRAESAAMERRTAFSETGSLTAARIKNPCRVQSRAKLMVNAPVRSTDE
jgi:hypothetical protein